jgi:hypothetical protein
LGTHFIHATVERKDQAGKAKIKHLMDRPPEQYDLRLAAEGGSKRSRLDFPAFTVCGRTKIFAQCPAPVTGWDRQIDPAFPNLVGIESPPAYRRAKHSRRIRPHRNEISVAALVTGCSRLVYGFGSITMCHAARSLP